MSADESGEINLILWEGHGLDSTGLNMHATEAGGIGPSGQNRPPASCSALDVHTRFPALNAIPKLNASRSLIPQTPQTALRTYQATTTATPRRSLSPSFQGGDGQAFVPILG